VKTKKMFVSLIPWLVFTLVINRRGADAAAIAALAAAMLSLLFLVKHTRTGDVKLIDVTGVVAFGALAVLGFSCGPSVTEWIADYGRGAAALTLAVIMFASVMAVPFTEQYARESVPREHWNSPVFQAVNRKISVLWGGVGAVMGIAHLLAGAIDPASNPVPGARPVDLVLNWALPIALIMFAVNATQKISGAVGNDPPPAPTHLALAPAQYRGNR
jgi:hypothetical protein